jgi:hypothetical protein
MRCRLYSPIQAIEGPLPNHLLREHPEARAAAALALPVGSSILARRPTGLIAFDTGLAGIALLVAAPIAWGRR